MQLHKIMDIEGTRFPAGRHTRVLVGENAPLRAEGFQMGRVQIFPGGKVPGHCHPNEEVYVALEGCGEIEVDGETQPFPAGSYIYIPPNTPHELRNPENASEDFIFLFTYSPADTVDHWQEELDGTLQ